MSPIKTKPQTSKWICLLVMISHLCVFFTVQAQTAREIARNAFPSVVVVIAENAKGRPVSFGSGFFITEDLVATCYHVIKGSSRVSVRIVGHKEVYEVEKVLATDKQNDLALLKMVEVKARPLLAGDDQRVAVGDDVYVIGNPEGLEGTLSQGIISGIRRIRNQRYIQITAPLSHGSSGGPVLNQRGRVIGIAVRTIASGQNLNFAIPNSSLITLAHQTINAIRIEESAKGYYELGMSLLEISSRPDEAVEAFEKAISLKPNYAEAYDGLGQAFEWGVTDRDFKRRFGGKPYESDVEADKQIYAKAIEAYKQAIRIRPDFAEAYNHLGNVYFATKDYLRAREAYKQAIRIRPNFAEAHDNLGVAYSATKNYLRAIEAYKKAIRIKPDFIEAYDHLGSAYDALSRKNQAIEARKQAVRVNPDNRQGYLNLAEVYYFAHRYNEAIESYKQAIRCSPSIPYTYQTLGDLYFRLARYTEAIDNYKQATRLDPYDADATHSLGRAYAELRRYNDAIEVYKIALKLPEPNRLDYESLFDFLSAEIAGKGMKVNIQYDLGKAYFRLRRYTDAISSFKEAIRLGDKLRHYDLGLAYLAVGDRPSALEAYRNLMRIKEQSTSADYIKEQSGELAVKLYDAIYK